MTTRRLSIRPCRWPINRFGGPIDVDGFKVGAHCYRTLAGAKRGAVALAEDDHDLANRIMVAEKEPDACFENVEHKLEAYRIAVRVPAGYVPTPIEPPSRVQAVAYEYNGCELVNTVVHLNPAVYW